MATPIPQSEPTPGSSAQRAPGRRVSFSGQVGILGPPSASGARPMGHSLTPTGAGGGLSLPGGSFPGSSHGLGSGLGSGLQQGAGGAGLTQGGQAWPPRLRPEQVEAELAEIGRVQAVVERLEGKLGKTHPQVGGVGW